VDMLVRVPDPGATLFSQSHYEVVPRDYKPDPTDHTCGPMFVDACTLKNQLKPLEYLEGKGLADDISVENGKWAYQQPVARIQALASENSGDIILFANMKEKYQFELGYKGNHGSLTAADAKVPIAVSYPAGAKDVRDAMLEEVQQYLEGSEVKESGVILRFFGLQP